MSKIEVGSVIKVPKGTLVTKGYYYSYNPGVATSRDSVVEVSHIFDVMDRNPDPSTLSPIGQEKFRRIQAEMEELYAIRNDKPQHAHYSRRDLSLRMEALLREEFPDQVWVSWSDGKKHARMTDVQLATKEEVELRATKAKKTSSTVEASGPTKRQKMVRGSKWQFTQDAILHKWVDNPAYRNFISDFWSKNSHVRHTGISAHDAATAAAVEEYLRVEIGSVVKGREFSITGKMSKAWIDANGLMVPCRFIKEDGSKRDVEIPLREIIDIVEEVSIPVVNIYVIRDAKTGKFFGKTMDFYSKSDEEALETIKWEDKWQKARQYDKLAVLRLALMGYAGYFAGIQQETEYWHEQPDRKIFDIPSTWEIVQIDKLSRTITSTLEIHNSLAASFRLRGLTVTYGPSVRAAYKAVEKKGVENFHGMIVFRSPLQRKTGTYPNGKSWCEEWRDELNDDATGKVDEAVRAIGAKRGTFTKAKDRDSIAIAYPSISEAVQMRLLYEGNLDVHVIDLKEMAEVVQ